MPQMFIANNMGIAFTKREAVVVMETADKRAEVGFKVTPNGKGFSLDRDSMQEAFRLFSLGQEQQAKAVYWLLEAAMFLPMKPFRIVCDQFGYEMFATLNYDDGLVWSDVPADAEVFDERDNREIKLAYWRGIAQKDGLDMDCVKIVEGAK